MHNISIAKSILCIVCLFAGELFAQSALTVRQVFDFNIGDEFHFSTSSYGNYTSNGGIRMYILDKTVSAANDTIMYQIHMNRFGQNINQQTGQLIDTVYQTRIYESTYYDLDSSLRQLSYSNNPSSYLKYYSLYYTYNTELANLEYNISQGLIDSSCINNFNLYFSDTLINWQLDTVNHNSYFASYIENVNPNCNLFNMVSYSQRFAEGLGSVAFSESVSGGPYYGSSHNMVYYRKGTTEVGTPIDNLVPTEEITLPEFNIFPNPVSDVINLISGVDYIGSDFTIYNLSGIALISGKISDKIHAISTTILLPGHYFLKLHNKASQTYKFLKI